LANGQYQPELHVAQELLKYPEEPLTKKQIQLFLGTIPSTGKRILQTDASERYWETVLLEQLEGKRHICGYRSGRFKLSEQHYHSTFKEILAVMNGIKKFEFYLVGYKFQVEMDISSFPKMLQFKQKQLPHPQLLRWAEWFYKFDFEVKHIKGKHNMLPNFLSRKDQALTRQTLQTEARTLLWQYQWRIFRYHGGLTLLPFRMHPHFPHIHPLRYSALAPYPKEMKWFYCKCGILALQGEEALEPRLEPKGSLDNDNEYREFQRIICEKNGALKDYNEENPPPLAVSQEQQSLDPLPPLDSQDPYSPDPEAFMQLDIDPDSFMIQTQSSFPVQQATQANDQAGPGETANLQDPNSWPQPVQPTQSHVREWWDDDLTIEDIDWALHKIKDKQRKMVNKRVMGSDYNSSDDSIESGDDPTTLA
ncbi:hypothetical protein CRG98_047204, partial [Punica granatum]